MHNPTDRRLHAKAVLPLEDIRQSEIPTLGQTARWRLDVDHCLEFAQLAWMQMRCVGRDASSIAMGLALSRRLQGFSTIGLLSKF